MEAKKKSLIPFFTKGDVGGLTYMITNNIVNYIIIIATLEGFGWPSEIIFGRVIPGLSIGLMCGGLYYAWMARKLSAKLERPDVTALPSGISTPAMFVILFGVISPIHYAIGDPELEWAAATAAFKSFASFALLSFMSKPCSHFMLRPASFAACKAPVTLNALMWLEPPPS